MWFKYRVARTYDPRKDVTQVAMEKLQELDRTYGSVQLIAIVPAMLSYFATSPERHEVTELDIIVEHSIDKRVDL